MEFGDLHKDIQVFTGYGTLNYLSYLCGNTQCLGIFFLKNEGARFEKGQISALSITYTYYIQYINQKIFFTKI